MVRALKDVHWGGHFYLIWDQGAGWKGSERLLATVVMGLSSEMTLVGVRLCTCGPGTGIHTCGLNPGC